MCLVLVAWQRHPRYPLVVAANRDEWRDRPALPLHRWPIGLYAGQDTRAGGTWLAVRPDGAFAATTNIREPGAPAGARSRGELPLRALQGDLEGAIRGIHAEADQYGGFHVIAADRRALWHVSSKGEGPTLLEPGFHGVSNGRRADVWPKVRSGLAALEQALQGEPDPEEILAILDDRAVPPDETLPDTGVGIEWERALGPRRIDFGPYGTRVSTVVLVGETTRMVERSWDPDGGRVALSFDP